MANCCLCGEKLGLMSSNDVELPGVKQNKKMTIKLCGRCYEKYNIVWSYSYSGIEEEQLESIKNRIIRMPIQDEVKDGIFRQIAYKQDKIRNLKEEQRKKEEKEQRKKRFLITTGYNFEGYNIIKYLNIVHGEVVLGTGFLSELSSSINDVFGTTSGTMQGKLSKAKTIAQEQLVMNSIEKGANAIIGVDFDVNILNNNMIVISANGTAVVIRPKQKKI